MINTFGTGKIPSNDIARIAQEEFDMRPAAIIKTLDLLRPIYRQTAAYGHFGRELPDFTWERKDRVESLRKRAGV
jgi:S-adenosylmethionine synthetase